MPNNIAKPMLMKSWGRSIKPRAARPASKPLVLHLSEFALPKEYRKGAQCEVDQRTGVCEVTVRTKTVGQHFFPPYIKTVSLPKRRPAGEPVTHTDGKIHDHLALAPAPAKLAKELQVRQRFGID